MGLKRTVSRLAAVLDSEGKITGYEKEVHSVFAVIDENNADEVEMSKSFTPTVKWEDATPEEIAAAFSDSAAKLNANHSEAHAAVANMQEQVATAQAELAQTKAASDDMLGQARAVVSAVQAKLDAIKAVVLAA